MRAAARDAPGGELESWNSSMKLLGETRNMTSDPRMESIQHQSQRLERTVDPSSEQIFHYCSHLRIS